MTKLLRFPMLICCVIALAATPALVRAQAVISGKIMSEQGQPLVGATVIINELAVSAGTSQTGHFTITIPPGASTASA